MTGGLNLLNRNGNAPALRVPQDAQRAVGRQVHRVVDQQTAVDDVGVGVAVGNGADQDRGVRIGSVARARCRSRPACPPGGSPRTSALAYSLLCGDVLQRAGRADRPLVKLRVFAPDEDRPGVEDRVEELHRRHVKVRAVAPGKEVQRLGSVGQGSTFPGLMVSQVGGAASFAQFVLGSRQIGRRRAAHVRRLDRITDPVLARRDADADAEDAGRTGRAPVLVGPGCRSAMAGIDQQHGDAARVRSWS